MTMDKLVAGYLRIRKAREEMAARHKAELAVLDEDMEKLEAVMNQQLTLAGVESARTAHGTVFKSTWTSARVQDWSTTLDYILENERFDLLEARVNKTTANEIGNVPGVIYDRGIRINVRSS